MKLCTGRTFVNTRSDSCAAKSTLSCAVLSSNWTSNLFCGMIAEWSGVEVAVTKALIGIHSRGGGGEMHSGTVFCFIAKLSKICSPETGYFMFLRVQKKKKSHARRLWGNTSTSLLVLFLKWSVRAPLPARFCCGIQAEIMSSRQIRHWHFACLPHKERNTNEHGRPAKPRRLSSWGVCVTAAALSYH